MPFVIFVVKKGEADMSSETPRTPALDWATAEDAYHIITTLLQVVRASNDLVAVMASALGEAGTKNVTETAAWADFLGSRKLLEYLNPEIEKFTRTMTELAKDRPDREDES